MAAWGIAAQTATTTVASSSGWGASATLTMLLPGAVRCVGLPAADGRDRRRAGVGRPLYTDAPACVDRCTGARGRPRGGGARDKGRGLIGAAFGKILFSNRKQNALRAIFNSKVIF